MTVWTVLAFYAICFLPIVVIFAVMPFIGRKTLSFGVSIPSGQYEDAELVRLRKRFAAGVVTGGAALTAVFAAALLFISAEAAIFVMSGMLLLYIVLVSVIYVRIWRQMKALKEERGWGAAAQATIAADTRFTAKKHAVSPAWFITYALVILGTVAAGLLLYNGMPELVPQKMDFAGNVIKYAHKSVGLVLFAPAMQAMMSIIFALVYWMILRTPPVIDPDNPEVTSRQNAAFRYRWSAFAVFGGLDMLLVFLVTQLGMTQVVGVAAQLWTPMVGAGLLLIGAFALAVTTGQSGSRIKAGRTSEGGVIRRDDDRYWKWGAIYVNKDDPSLFVERRFGIGFTMNFGRPAALAIIIGFLVFIAAVTLLAVLLVK